MASFKRLKPLLITSLFTFFGSYSSLTAASLSSTPATPTQIKIVAKTATLEQIQAQTLFSKPQANANVSPKAKNSLANQKVSAIYRKWAGTRYRLGGSSHSGIDCSAFVQKTMQGAFNIALPRSTAEQRYIGKAISKSELRTGDLVFFRKNHHVGVYIGNGKFVHASTSKGVTTSSLSESYWARNYTQSRRVM